MFIDCTELTHLSWKFIVISMVFADQTNLQCNFCKNIAKFIINQTFINIHTTYEQVWMEMYAKNGRYLTQQKCKISIGHHTGTSLSP